MSHLDLSSRRGVLTQIAVIGIAGKVVIDKDGEVGTRMNLHLTEVE